MTERMSSCVWERKNISFCTWHTDIEHVHAGPKHKRQLNIVAFAYSPRFFFHSALIRATETPNFFLKKYNAYDLLVKFVCLWKQSISKMFQNYCLADRRRKNNNNIVSSLFSFYFLNDITCTCFVYCTIKIITIDGRERWRESERARDKESM